VILLDVSILVRGSDVGEKIGAPTAYKPGQTGQECEYSF
jgi:hypothetical protein